MSLKPGNIRYDGKKYVVDENAIADSMARKMDEEMKRLYSQMYNRSMTRKGEADRRLFFVAISRGILRYLKEKEGELIKNIHFRNSSGSSTVSNVTYTNLDITS